MAGQNKMTDGEATWRIALEVPSASHFDAIETALSLDGAPVSTSEIAPGAGWRMEVHCTTEPDRAAITARIIVAAAIGGIETPDFVIEKMATIDWVKRVQENSPPVSAGKFYIHGSHVAEPVPESRIGLLIDAGAAFGTGTHETTQGCLIAFERISQFREIRASLDLGCGSGILAIGIAKLWPASVLAADNDPMAVEVTAENAKINNVADKIKAIQSDGFKATAISDHGPFELIAANILAEPLITLAPDIAHHLAPGGEVVLSGLLEIQSDDVVAAHERAGLKLGEQITLGEWRTLVMRRP